MLSFSAERIQLESASGRTAPEKGKLSGAGLRANLGEKASQSQPINIYIYQYVVLGLQRDRVMFRCLKFSAGSIVAKSCASSNAIDLKISMFTHRCLQYG